MSGLFTALNQSAQALGVQTQAIQISGKNLANVDNPNYARQKVIYGSQGTVATPTGAQSMGLQVESIQAVRDPLLDAQVVRETGTTASYNAQQAALSTAQGDLGQTVSAGSANADETSSTNSAIGAAISSLFNSFQAVAADPTDSGSRATLVAHASDLTDQMNGVDARLNQLQSDLTSQTTTDVSSANTILSTIADLNGQIGRYEINNPGSAVDLRDQRQQQLEALAQKISITSKDDPSHPGQIQVSAQDSSGNPILLVDRNTVPGALTFNGATASGGNPSTAISLQGGSIQGHLIARDGTVQTLRDNLDALAKQLVTSVNAAYNPLGSTGNFFDPTKMTAGTISVLSSVTPTSLKASDGGAAGDNTIAQAVAALANKKFSTASSDAIDGTFGDMYSSTVINLGQSLSTMNQRVDDQTNVQTLVTNQRSSVSGVSLDEEMTNLMTYQRAYQASSRVVSVIDDLLQNLINLGKN